MKYFIYLIFLILLFGLNLGVFSFFKFYGVAPNLLLLVVMLFALDKESLDFLFVALISGLLLDFYSGIFFGGFSFGLVLFAYLLNLAAQKLAVFDLNWKFLSGVLLLSVAFMNLFLWVYYFVVFKFGWASINFVDLRLLGNRFFIQFFYDLLLLFFVFKLKFWAQKLVDSFNSRL